MKTTALVVSSVVGLATLAVILSVMGAALGIITIPWLNFTSKIQSNQDIVQKTYQADNVIYNYHWFQERAGAVKALSDTITQSQDAVVAFETTAGPRKEWTFEDKTEDARLNAVVQGQKAQYNSLSQEYNARAGEADRSLFVNGLQTFFKLF